LENTPGALPLGLDEDCLQLNVYTPSLQGQRPTMVWFYGGNLTGGSTSGNLVFDPAAREGCNPTFFSHRHDVVVVTATYRVNVFGFLNLEGGAANCGLLDAVAALRWVNKEISHFGGDPQNVTVFGLSAGGHITSQLLCMPVARDLFHKAICMSGSAQWTMGTLQDHERRIGSKFAQKLGFESLSEMTIQKARQLSAETLRQGYMQSGEFLECGTLNVDGKTAPYDPLDMMHQGCAKDIKIMSGVTRDEGVFSAAIPRHGSTIEDVIENVKDHFARTCYLMTGDVDALRNTSEDARRAIATELVHRYQDLTTRFSESSSEVRRKSVNLSTEKFPAAADENYELAVKILGDHDFTLSHVMALWELGQHASVYAYVFSDESVPGHTVAGHGSDHKYLWGTQPTDNDEDQRAARLSAQIMESWASFARDGDPSTQSVGKWSPISFPRWTTDTSLPALPAGWEHMNFECGRTGTVSFASDEVRIWCQAAVRLAGLLGGLENLRPSLARMIRALYGEL